MNFDFQDIKDFLAYFGIVFLTALLIIVSFSVSILTFLSLVATFTTAWWFIFVFLGGLAISILLWMLSSYVLEQF